MTDHPDPQSLATQTAATIQWVEQLRDRAVGPTDLPHLAALAHTADPHAAVEHEPGTHHPLLDHLHRVLDRKLAGLETRDIARFQHDDALSEKFFIAECDRLATLDDRHHALLRIALLHLDFAKGGTPQQRRAWQNDLEVDLSIHNQAAAQILERTGGLAPFDLSAEEDELVRVLIASHGLAGQAVRGETPLALFAPFARYLVAHEPEPALTLLHLVNVCDTAGVREGLLTDGLTEELRGVVWRVADVAANLGPGTPQPQIEDALATAEDALYDGVRPRLVDRLSRLRAGRIRAGEPISECRLAIAELDDQQANALAALWRSCQLWYAESATSALSALAQLKVLTLGMKAAAVHADIDTTRPYHLSLQPLVRPLYESGDAKTPYRIRLIETLLSQVSLADILTGHDRATALHQGPDSGALATFPAAIGGSTAIALGLEESEEAAALLTLLSIYETKNSAAFHSVLKMLCDLYDLRKDEFDRVSNESAYLVHMNSARSDKARMLDYVEPGRILEVGPGGGIVLDLLEDRFPTSEVIGLDVSQMVIDALQERKQREGRRWSLIEGDAYELSQHVAPASLDTIVFCSVLHEIYSYVERPTRFRLESVRDLLIASWQCIKPGGRIVIRDGVTPPAAVRVIEFLEDSGREFFDLFVAQFEGRPIQFEELEGGKVRLSAADAMEFLYTYTWGPSSFPYEVREQYGVLPYDEYRDHILEWLAGSKWVELPQEARSYLQPGYEAGLAPKIRLTDEHGAPARLPDSNCLLVFERV